MKTTTRRSIGPARTGLEKGAPLHLVNVTINETLDGGSGLQHNDLRGIGMAIGPAGISAGIRHHLVFAEPSWRVFPEVPEDSSKAGERDARTASRPYRMFEYGTKAEGAEHGPCPIRYEGEGLTLGRWTGISGAAFSTGMGSRTSLAASLLLGFFNVRLGYWWDSGVKPGRRSGIVTRTGACERVLSWLFPVQSHLLAEFMARFHGPARRWWNLSDGGHFENMGGYELIRRRVPLIVIVDAEADPDYRFEGLGNFVRKARVDFGAEIEFVAPEKLADAEVVANSRLGSLEMLRRGAQGTEPASPSPSPRSRAHAALAIVRYLDGATPDSLLVYVKPTILGDEPVDIHNYHAENPDFPQQTTADQFFDEAQWESYRKLGRLVGERVFEKGLRAYLDLRAKHLSDSEQSTS